MTDKVLYKTAILKIAKLRATNKIGFGFEGATAIAVVFNKTRQEVLNDLDKAHIEIFG
jgi:hypothetical protein